MVIYRRSVGLNNRVDPARVPYEWRDGLAGLARADNVSHDPTGMIRKAAGYTEKISGNYRNLLPCGDYLLITDEDSGKLCVVDINFEVTAVGDITPGRRMSYAKVTDNHVFFMNGVEKGRVVNRAVMSWEYEGYVGPDTSRVYSGPPLGEHIALFSGRMCIASGDVVWYSEPMSYSMYDLGQGFMWFPAEVRALGAVDGYGLFVGTSAGIYLVSGTDYRDMSILHLSESPVYHGGGVSAPVGVPGKESARMCFFVSQDGVYLGTSGGLRNITKERLSLPGGVSAGAAVFDDALTFWLEG